MIPNRVFELDDYLDMSRRHSIMILAFSAIALGAGFLVSFAFPPKYTSTSLLQVEQANVIPNNGIVKPYTPTFMQVNFREISERRNRMMSLQQQVLSRNHLQELVNRLGLAKKGKTVDAVIDEIQANFSVSETDPSAPLGTESIPYVFSTPGFSTSFTAGSAHEAQQVCRELASSLLTEDIKAREQEAVDATDFLSRQLDDARANLDGQDARLALFKGQHLGQLPEDAQENLRVLSGLDTQLEASTQLLNRAQQDKAYAESVLAQQLDAWKTSVTSESIERQLATLRTQLVALKTRYTDNYPEVIKMKHDIEGLEATQKALSDPSDQNSGAATPVVGKAESPEILQLRQQVNQNAGVIERTSQEQKRLQEMIATYQKRLTRSPEVEEEYNQLTRDSQTAHQVYENLMTSKRESEIHADLERHQQGEKLRLLNPASFPNSPSFPERWKFAVGGLAVGLTLSICIALWLELRDKALRSEADVLAGVELPMLTSIPSVRTVVLPKSSRESLRGPREDKSAVGF